MQTTGELRQRSLELTVYRKLLTSTSREIQIRYPYICCIVFYKEGYTIWHDKEIISTWKKTQNATENCTENVNRNPRFVLKVIVKSFDPMGIISKYAKRNKMLFKKKWNIRKPTTTSRGSQTMSNSCWV